METQPNNSELSGSGGTKNFFMGRGLGRSLLLWFLFLSLIPLLIASTISYFSARDALREDAYNALETVTKLKTANISSYFNEHLMVDLDNQARMHTNVNLLESLTKAWQRSNKSLSDFVKSYPWEVIVHEQAADLITFTKTYHDQDVLLLDTQGNVLFSVKRWSDLGTNLVSSGDPKLSAALEQALKSGKPVFSDLIAYAPADNRVTGFLISVLLNDSGDKIGLIVLEISVDAIDSILQHSLAQGDSGAIYLIGNDLKMRSHSHEGGRRWYSINGSTPC
ncbi:cache domain-containing protein [Dongshaea marina]|uniref:cache domain-containing protein n=1 Tax=Dongshaea marina TaxID=2047966 RepID=UPI000D3E54C8|nr:cache domain-containing protein [Dongshaea marina]